MPMSYHRNGYIILTILLAFYPINSVAIDFSQCFADVISCAENSSGCTFGISNVAALSVLRTSRGESVTTVDAATALSYAGCTTYCGTGQEAFSWTSFSQQYAAWLLPYLSLLSQLPYGAQYKTDNFMSAILTLGSPTLAGYSLYMTLLNVRWVRDELFAGIDFPSALVRRSVVEVLTSLQQIPLRVHPGESARFESLVVHPDNDHWWTTFAEGLDYSQKWSIASATSIAWVVIAYLLTVADSISNVPDDIDSNGRGTGSGLLWLLPVIVGWLVLLLKCNYDRVHDAYRKANRQVFVASSDDSIASPSHAIPNLGFTIDPGPDLVYAKDITSPDELRVPPVFNYARTFSWYRHFYLISLFYRAAWRKSSSRVGVDDTIIPGDVCKDMPRASRIGTHEQIVSYCQPDDHDCSEANTLWPRGLFYNMIVASLMSLQLQWGTTCAAILGNWFTPTIGFGCRSLAYVIYGTLSTAVWMLLVASSMLGYYAHHLLESQPCLDLEKVGQNSPSAHFGHIETSDSRTSALQEKPAVPSGECSATNSDREEKDVSPDVNPNAPATATTKHQTRRIYVLVMLRIADWLRWIGKSLAIINAVGIIANSIFQYAGVYTNCFCDSNMYTWGASAFTVISPDPSDIDLARKAWIGALVLSLFSCLFFVGSVYRALPSRVVRV